jgi:glucokinase
MMNGGQPNSAMRLIADIGGTNVRFALLPPGSTPAEQEKNLICSDFPGSQAARHYLMAVAVSGVKEAAFDVATAVTSDLIKLTNSPWAFSIEQTAACARVDQLLLIQINDFTALASSLPLLGASELRKVGGADGVKGAPSR